METVKRLSDLDPGDVAAVERVFGRTIKPNEGTVLILKTADAESQPSAKACSEVPNWCDVLEGMSDADLSELNAMLGQPVRFARSSGSDGS